MQRILLGQLCSNGDCLYATIVAHQIKKDFPDCHLVWAISSMTTEVIKNNPHVDEVWVVPMHGWSDMVDSWYLFEREAMRLYVDGYFDQIFLTQIYPGNYGRFDGTVRPSILRNYPSAITVPIETGIYLTEEETQKVDAWFASQRCSETNYVAIMECSSKSGQSFMTVDLAIAVAERILQRRNDISIIVSTHEEFETKHSNIISGRALTMRETARLTHYADLFIGCGSGLTVVATSAAAKANLPNIQALSPHTGVYASFAHDFRYFGKSADHFLEMTTADPGTLANAICSTLDEGINAARGLFDAKIEVDFAFYLSNIDGVLIRRGKYIEAANALTITAERYGAHSQLTEFAENLVLPFLEKDATFEFPQKQIIVDRCRMLFD